MFSSLLKITVVLTFIASSALSFSQTALSFDGVDDHVVAINAGPTGTSNRTVECWIKTSSTLTTQQVLVNWGSMSPSGARFTFNTIQNGKIRIELGGNGFNSNNTINDGNWHHVAVVYNHLASLKATLYVDGAIDTARNFTVSTNTTNTIPITIGKRIDNTNYFDGDMDEIKIWDIALTTAQLRASMFTSYCNTPANLVAYYKLEEGIPNGINTLDTIAIDYSANANDAALRGFNLQSVGLSNWVVGNAAVISTLDTNISQNNNVLTANDTGATYQWIDCNLNSSIPGETNRSFVGQISGSYAVELTKGSCVDTSMCYVLTIQGLNALEYISDQFSVYPSLFEDGFKLQLERTDINTTVQIHDLRGKIILEKSIVGNSSSFIELNAPAGIYLVKLQNDEGEAAVVKVVKK